MGASMKYVGDSAVKKLLGKYGCPTPFHVVRMRFLGQIASPAVGINPSRTIQSFWPEGMPVFESQTEAEKLFGALMGLWNHLTRHQKGVPVKLSPLPKFTDRNDPAVLMRTRREEIGAFVDGLAVNGMEMMLPSPLMNAIAALGRTADLLMDAEKRIGTDDRLVDGTTLKDYDALLGDRSAAIEELIGTIVLVSTKILSGMMAEQSGRLH